MINIVGLNKQQIKGFTTSENFIKFPFAPISQLREISHIQNTRAKDDDILLFLAYENEELTGYLGILPDDVTKTDGRKIHFGWLSTIFVSEKSRGKQIAQKLLYAAGDSYDNNLLITEFTENAARVYNKIGLFEDLNSIKAIRYYFKSNLAELLPSKKEVFANNKIWLKRFDSLMNVFIPYFGTGKNHLYKISKTWDKNLEKFISKQKKNPIARSSEEFKWILNSPWISTEKGQPNYLFSSYSKQYKIFWVSVYQNQEIVSAMLCSVRNGHLKVLYYFGNITVISDVLPQIIKLYTVKMMTIYNDQLNYEIRKNKTLRTFYKRPLERKYMIHKNFKEKLGKDFNFNFSDGDGDFSFT